MRSAISALYFAPRKSFKGRGDWCREYLLRSMARSPPEAHERQHAAMGKRNLRRDLKPLDMTPSHTDLLIMRRRISM